MFPVGTDRQAVFDYRIVCDAFQSKFVVLPPVGRIVRPSRFPNVRLLISITDEDSRLAVSGE